MHAYSFKGTPEHEGKYNGAYTHGHTCQYEYEHAVDGVDEVLHRRECCCARQRRWLKR